MVSLPIPDRTSPIRYADLEWRGRNLGELVTVLSKGKQRAEFRAHLDPDLRRESLERLPGWRPSLGQIDAAQGHLQRQGVGPGDLFLFWGLFRRVSEELGWTGRPVHVIWGWMQVGSVASVDRTIRTDPDSWQWLGDHPHLEFRPSRTNTLYVASERLLLPHGDAVRASSAGTFDVFSRARCLTADEARGPSLWSLPTGFLPRGRPPLTYHGKPERWSTDGDRVLLRTVGRGQEFVLDLDHYPELVPWLAELLDGGES